mgnify:CR=1 FL=1
MTKTTKTATDFWVVLSQIFLVPICAIFKCLSLVLEGFLWCGGKVLDFLSWVFGPASRGITFIKNSIARKSQSAKFKRNLLREERRVQRNAESVKNDGKNAVLKKICLTVVKVLALIALLPFIVLFLAFALVYGCISAICEGIKSLFLKAFGIKRSIQREKIDSSDKPEAAWKSDWRWDVYPAKQAVSEYFNKYIFCFNFIIQQNLTR